MPLLAFIAVMQVMNHLRVESHCHGADTTALIANETLRDTVRNIVTAVVAGGVAMIIIFAVDNKIFDPGFGKR